MHLEASTIIRATIGGLLIGGAAALLLLCDGRIAGISGIFGRLLAADPGHDRWRVAFVLGLLAAAWMAMASGHFPAPHVQGGLLLAGVAGVLTGAGTGLANGCTSGHGVCGLSNLSLRSLVATLTFMGAAGFTVYLTRHLPWSLN